MPRYVVLYNSTVSAAEQMANATPEQTKAGMDLWMAWATKAGDAIVDLGAPLGTSAHLEAGSATPGSSQASGYSILQGDSLEAVTNLLMEHPHFQAPGASIDVFECLTMPGM